MHPELWDFLTGALAPYRDAPVTVLDFGGADANGWHRVCELFPASRSYCTVDIRPGPGVDIVADAADWIPDQLVDVVISTEVFEHAYRWPAICETAHDALHTGGLFVASCATDPRPPHSAIDGWDLRPGEFYRNVTRGALERGLERAGFREVTITGHPRGDLYALATR